MFGVRYLLLPAGQQPAVPAKLIASSGRHRLYEVANTGYFQVVDASAPITENRTDIEQQSRAWRTTDLASQAIYPSVAFAGISRRAGDVLGREAARRLAREGRHRRAERPTTASSTRPSSRTARPSCS